MRTMRVNNSGCVPKSWGVTEIKTSGFYIYSYKKNGEKYKKPFFVETVGVEKTAEDVIRRLEKLNPGSKFSI